MIPPTEFAVRELSESEIQAYRRDGVIHLPARVSDGVADLLAAADGQLHTFRGSHGAWDNNLAGTADRGVFFSQRQAYLQQPALARLLFDSRLAEAAGRAMGSQKVRFYFDHLFMLESDTAKDHYRWHQDPPYWACAGEQVCSFWLALTDCDVDSGALEFVLGSDLGELYPPPKVWRDGDAIPHAGLPATPKYHEQRDAHGFVSWSMKAGDCLLFNGRIMHSTRSNHSTSQLRVAYSTRWIGDDMRYVEQPHYQDPLTLPEPGIAPGRPLSESQRFALCWEAGKKSGGTDV